MFQKREAVIADDKKTQGEANTWNEELSNHWTKKLFKSTMYAPNSTRTWVQTDSYEMYIGAAKRHRDQNRPFPWRPDSFEYTFNSFGFRGPDPMTQADFKILVCGCSFTFGVGLPYEMTWPELLSTKIPGSIAINLALGGTSNDYSSRAIFRTIDIIKPQLVAVLWPPSGRFEHIKDSDKHAIYSIGVSFTKDFPKMLTDKNYQYYSYLKNLNMLQMTCNIAGVPLVHAESCPEFDEDRHDIIYTPKNELLARDGLHNGPLWQERIANLMFQKYQDLTK